MATEHFLKLIEEERTRQRSLQGSEFDSNNTVNDWIAIINYYVSESALRKSGNSYQRASLTREEYENSLIKAGAVILAALEHSGKLESTGVLEQKGINDED